MSIFKRTKASPDKDTKESKDSKKEKGSNEPKVIKKTKIGFRSKKKEKLKKDTSQQSKKEEETSVEIEQEGFEIENTDTPEQKSEINTDEIEALPDEIIGDEGSDTLKKETQWTSSKKKKKRIITTDMKGKPVFLEDTGEKLGIVFDMILDGEKKIVGYKIKDQKSESVLSFPIDQFDQTKDGLIFLQSWYINALKTLEKLEFKERVSPELTTLITDDTISNEELYNIFVKHDDQMANYIEEAVSLKELLYKRLKALEKQRLALKDSLMDLTEKRLIKDIDRREFSEDVMAHRRKVNVLDVNINKCKELIKRLDSTSFGKLGKHIITHTDAENEYQYLKTRDSNKTESNLFMADQIENPYKQKYDNMKVRYEQLTEDYNELKSAVEKLISKGEL
ncbi:MAG: PRC-barrel domain-containing protein [Thermoplasmatales archaeon]|nr:PRC-barrel domain-containing protein [Thermoplasmatales archaeon]